MDIYLWVVDCFIVAGGLFVALKIRAELYEEIRFLKNEKRKTGYWIERIENDVKECKSQLKDIQDGVRVLYGKVEEW